MSLFRFAKEKDGAALADDAAAVLPPVVLPNPAKPVVGAGDEAGVVDPPDPTLPKLNVGLGAGVEEDAELAVLLLVAFPALAKEKASGFVVDDVVLLALLALPKLPKEKPELGAAA